MPSVPAGFSIRPWLLRVAVLVALDAVRERSETPQQLLASLQLPPPAAPPRIVDADPSDTDTMELGITRMETLANRPETAIADAWDTLPVDVERELIRRLLSGLPEGDAELLALGVVGQIPTRDLAALAGTSQRSIRRRIARALILFQSRYYSVRQEALPPASTEKSLPLSESATTPIELARRGFNEAGDRVLRTLQGVRTGFGSSDAQERLQTLRATDVPAAEMMTGPLPTTQRAAPLDVVDAASTMQLPRLGDGPPEATDDAFTDWTASVPSMEVPDLATAQTPIVPHADQATAPLPRSAHGPPPPANISSLPSVIPMPPASDTDLVKPSATPPRDEDAVTIPAPEPQGAIITPTSASLTAMTEPLPIVAAESATVVRTAPDAPSSATALPDVALLAEADALEAMTTPTSTEATPTLIRPDPATTEGATVPRRLPRFGPPPEEVVTAANSAITASAAPAPTDEAEAAMGAAGDETPTLVMADELGAIDLDQGVAVTDDEVTPSADEAFAQAASPVEPEGAPEVVLPAFTDETPNTASSVAITDEVMDAEAADAAPMVDAFVAGAAAMDAADLVVADAAPDEIAAASDAADSETPDAFAMDAADTPVAMIAATDTQIDESIASADPIAAEIPPAQETSLAEAVALPIMTGTWSDEPSEEPVPLASDDVVVGDADTERGEEAMVAEVVPLADVPEMALTKGDALAADTIPADDEASTTLASPDVALPPITLAAAANNGADLAIAEDATEAVDTLATTESPMELADAMPDDAVDAAPEAEPASADDAPMTVLAATEADGTAAPNEAAPEADGIVVPSEAAPEADGTVVPSEAAPEADGIAVPNEATPEADEAAALAPVAEEKEAVAPESQEMSDVAADDTIPAPPLAAIERTGDAVPRRGTLNSTVVLPPLDRADYVSRHRPAWLDMGDLGSLPGVTLDANADPDAPVARSPSVPSLGAMTVAAAGTTAQQVGDIPAATPSGTTTMDLADLADLTDAVPEAAPTPSDSHGASKPLRAPTRPLPKLDRDIMDTPRER